MNRERELILSALSGWDTLIVGSVRLSCIFEYPYEEALGAEGAAASALVATADILGTEKHVTLEQSVTQVTVETMDGRTEGPFVVETHEPGDPGSTLLRLRLV